MEETGSEGFEPNSALQKSSTPHATEVRGENPDGGIVQIEKAPMVKDFKVALRQGNKG